MPAAAKTRIPLNFMRALSSVIPYEPNHEIAYPLAASETKAFLSKKCREATGPARRHGFSCSATAGYRHNMLFQIGFSRVSHCGNNRAEM